MMRPTRFGVYRSIVHVHTQHATRPVITNAGLHMESLLQLLRGAPRPPETTPSHLQLGVLRQCVSILCSFTDTL